MEPTEEPSGEQARKGPSRGKKAANAAAVLAGFAFLASAWLNMGVIAPMTADAQAAANLAAAVDAKAAQTDDVCAAVRAQVPVGDWVCKQTATGYWFVQEPVAGLILTDHAGAWSTRRVPDVWWDKWEGKGARCFVGSADGTCLNPNGTGVLF